MILPALVKYLKDNLSISRVYTSQAPQGVTLPAVTIDLEGAFRNRHYGSAGSTDTGLVETDFEISVWSDKFYTASQVADEIVSLLANHRGQWSSGESPDVTHYIADIEINSESSGFDPSTEHHAHSLFIVITHS